MSTVASKNTVIVGIGIPGCGKTTYLKPLSRELDMSYVNPDEIRQQLTGDPADHSQEVLVWNKVHEFISQHIERGVIVDATYSKRRDRHELIKLCRKGGAQQIIAYWFDVPIEICQSGNAGRDRVVPKEALIKMQSRLDANPPSTEEGFTEIKVLRG